VATTWTYTPTFKSAETISSTDSPLVVGSGSTKRQYQRSVSSVLLDTDTPGPDTLVAKKYTLTNGSPTTLDLTAAPRAENDDLSVDCTGKQLLGWHFSADPANTGTVTIAVHGTNGYNVFGSATGTITLMRGQDVSSGMQRKTDATLPTWGMDAVAAGDKQIELSTSLTGSILYLHMVFG
jgi:hypothetical protein